MNKFFTGRLPEQDVLLEALHSPAAEMIAVLGRRRVGKTHLIKHTYASCMDFHLTGVQDASLETQLQNFYDTLAAFFKIPGKTPVPVNWMEAFRLLRKCLEQKKTKRKKVLFFDELPWMATVKSGFTGALGHFWNDWAAYQNIVLVICGSAASWMIKQVVHHKGGLHNRITKVLHLKPFNLYDTEVFLQTQGIVLNRYQLIQLYMITGGVPYYLAAIKKGQSVAQNIDRMCFHPGGLLRDEFDKLYNSLYDKPQHHVAVVRALADQWKGLSRKEILNSTGWADGGSVTRVLEELEQSDFIETYQPFDKKKKDTLYRLTDCFSLFYLKFMEGRKKFGAGTFVNLAKSAVWKSWCGFAFENVCLYHLPQLKQALGIPGVYTETASYVQRATKEQPGIQIDLLIDRADGIINLCEMKFYDAVFTITKEYAAVLRTRRAVFREGTRSRKTVFITMITCFGITKNAYANELLQGNVEADALFVNLPV